MDFSKKINKKDLLLKNKEKMEILIMKSRIL